MNIVDIVLVVILFYGLVRGFFRGFFSELASLVGIIAGIYIAVYFSHILSDYLVEKVSWNIQIVKLTAFAITFIIIVILIALIGKFLTKIAGFAALGILNKLIGAGFGFIKVAFIVSVAIMFFGSTNEDINLVEEKTLEESVLFSPIKTIAPILIPSILKEAKELDIIEGEKET